MRYQKFKSMGHRMLALLLTAVLLVQAAPVIPANAAEVPTAQKIAAETVPETVPTEIPEVSQNEPPQEKIPEATTEEVIPEATAEKAPEATAPETTPEAVPDATEQTIPVTTPETVPDATEQASPETTDEKIPEPTEETVPETTVETVPETTEETVPTQSSLQSITIVDAPKTVEVISITALSAVLAPEDSQETITWSVKPEELASIDEDGVLTVLEQTGVLEITAAAGGLSHTVQVEIVEPAAQAEELAEGKELPGYIFGETWDSTYDVLYYFSDESYVYDGQAVSFPDGNTVLVGETSYPIKNAVTSVSAVTEDGKTTVTFSGLSTPVGGIPQEWNSNFDGKFAIHGKVNGQAVTPTVVDRISNVKLVIDTPDGGSFTFTNGTIYEQSNSYGSGHDFGNGVVYHREFGYLPEFTITVEAPVKPPVPPEQPEPPASNAPFTARIGDKVLTILDGKTEHCDKWYGDVPVYTVVIPEGETADSFTLSGEGLAYIKGGGCADRTWDIDGSVELKILDGKSYHMMKNWEAFHVAFQNGNPEPPAPPVPPAPPEPPTPPAPPMEDAPFTARIGDKVLTVENGGTEYCEKAGRDVQVYTIVVPVGTKTFTLVGDELAYVNGGGCADGTWDIDGSEELEVLTDSTYHFQKGLTDTFHVKFREADAEPELPPVQPGKPTEDAPFTAKSGDVVLTIEDGGKEYCGKTYGEVQVYTVVVPVGTKTFTLVGDGLSYIKGGGCADRTWDIEGSVELEVLADSSYHFRKGWTDTFHVKFREADAEPELPPVQPGKPTENAPFTAKIGEKPLIIEEGPAIHCDKGGDVPYYIVVIPKGETAQSVAVTGELAAYSEGEGGEEHSCDGSAELPILKGKSYHVAQGFRPFPVPHVEYYHIAFRYDDGALKIPKLTASIGTRELEVAEVSSSGYGCGVTHTYAVKVPDTLQSQPIVIDGLKDYSYRAVNAGDACEGAQEAFGGTVTVNEFGYHFTADEKYDPDYRQLHIVFQEFHEDGPKAPFSVLLAGKELQVDVIPPASSYAPVGLVIHVPTPFAKTVTFSGVKGWMYMEKNTATGQMYSIETNDWQAEVLKPGEYQNISNWPERYQVTYEVAEAAEAQIVLNAQMDGKFLLPPETVAGVVPGLAKSLGYTYGEGITEMDITALDALVKMHQLKYPGEDVTKYLALDEKGMITKAFGVETGAVGFAVNGTAPATPIHATRMDEGSTLDFYNFQDTDQWSDKMVWLEQNGQKKTRFTAAVGQPITLAVKSADYQGNVAAVSGVQLATVAADGTITPMQGITDENGTISVRFPVQGTYTVTVISSKDIKIIMPVVHVTVSDNTALLSVEARTAGRGDLLSATVMQLNPDEPQTVKDLLDAAAREFSLDVSYTQGGGLQSINGLSGTEGGWRYFVNGKAAQDSVEEHKVAMGDEIRIRFAVSASAEELNAPLYGYLEKLVAEANNKLKLSYTQETKQVLQASVTAAEEVLKDPANNSAATDRELLVSKHIAAVNAGIAQLVAEETALDPAIPKDFENDLWLQYDHKNLKVGDTASIYPRRVPQIIDDPINNHVTRPVFTFTLVEGDSVTLSDTESREKTTVTAVKEGTSVVKVSYRAEGDFGPCSPINEGLVVFHVTGGEAALNIETSLSEIRSYDTIYYADSDTVSYPFTVSVQDAQKVEVFCNGNALEETNGSYTAQLENRSNVIEVIATDAQGATATYYQVVDARKIQIVVDNLTSPGQPFKINDRVRVSFRGITMPVTKLATIYNPVFKTWDDDGNEVMPSHVVYENQKLGTQRGYCHQYDLATKNSFEVTFTEAGDYSFTNGRIHCTWWGDALGSDKEKEGSGEQNLGAPIRQDDFCRMPDFTIHVSDEVSDHVPVKGITLNKEALTLKEGESFQLTAQVLPEDATNRNVTWSCDDPTGFFIELTKDGRIVARNAATKEKPAVTVTVTTEEGDMTASCKVVVQAVPHKITVENGTASIESAPRKTVVTVKADQAPKGQRFDHWEVVSGTVNLKNSKQAETTFVMADTDVTVRAVYTNALYKVTVENGSATPNDAAPGKIVTIRADRALSGQKFDHWEVVSGEVRIKNSKNAETTFVMPDMNVSLKAVYANNKAGGTTHRYPSKSSKPVSNTVDVKVEKGGISASTLEQIKGTDKNIRIKGKLENGKEFIWTINGKDVDVVKELKVGMSQKGKFQKDIEMLAENPEIFRFQEDGKLPYPMMVEMPSELADGAYLLMHYNTADRRAEKVVKVTVKDGMFRFLAKEGGEYFLAKRVSGKTVSELEAAAVVDETVPETTEAATEETTENTNQTVNRESRFIWILLALAAAGCGYLLGAMTKKRKEK